MDRREQALRKALLATQHERNIAISKLMLIKAVLRKGDRKPMQRLGEIEQIMQDDF